jgi:hypothetical protein
LRGNVKFQDQMDQVHIDEKWFWICKDVEKYLLVDGEEPPHRHVRHKSYIMEKGMFFTAVAIPRWDPTTRRRMWDGKIGIWPCGHWYLAERNSVNRPAGTKLWRNDESMGHEMYKEYVVDKLIPAIMEKWPLGEWSDPRFTIKIQQDNAGGHASTNDRFITAAIKSMEQQHVFMPGKISFYAHQPANSPDLNILDLGFFNAFQSHYLNMEGPEDQSIEVMDCVTQAYNEYPANKLNRLWVSLQSIYNCIIETHGCQPRQVVKLRQWPQPWQGWRPL